MGQRHLWMVPYDSIKSVSANFLEKDDIDIEGALKICLHMEES